jgi:uncharacterized protein (TIGR02646 family)
LVTLEHGARATGFGVVIPVTPQPEPTEFDTRVRQRGNTWILNQNLDQSVALPEGMDYPKPAYWAMQDDGYSCLNQLYLAYKKVCAYTGIFISGGAKSVDHFVPKSRNVGLAFEWSNYRLACRNINGIKRDFEDVLDPFLLESETFFLVLETGEIYVNPQLENMPLGIAAQQTITRLKLSSEEHQNTRADYYTEFKNGEKSASELQKYAPFVYLEAQRQDQL